MISAEAFVEGARARGFDWYAGVPCSYLAPLINYVLDDEGLSWVSSANEGDAVAAAAGAVLGGRRSVAMMQNSGLGNAVNPLTSLAYPFRIPVLVITTLRGDPAFPDEPQHELMGRITGPLLQQLQVPWAYLPDEPDEIDAVLDRADEYMRADERPYALVVRKGSVAGDAFSGRRPVAGAGSRAARLHEHDGHGVLPTRADALRRIVEHTPQESSVVIGTTGYTSRELFAIADRPNQLYMVGSMGCASSLGLGLSLARPDLRVVVVEGDGAALMRMGNFATVGAYGGPNLVHIVLDNQTHETTGGQATVSAGISFATVAAACGYEAVWEGDELTLLDDLFGRRPRRGPLLAHLRIRPGTLPDLPRPSLSPQAVHRRLVTHIGSAPCYS